MVAHVTVPALDPSAAWMTPQLMEQVLTRGTAATARSMGFKLPAAGKTGTTNDFKDAWFVGYTSTLTCGARPLAPACPVRLLVSSRAAPSAAPAVS